MKLSTTNTWDQYAHRVVMDNNSKNKDLREWNPTRTDHHVLLIQFLWDSTLSNLCFAKVVSTRYWSQVKVVWA